MQKGKINFLILCSLLGFGISLYLTIHHFKILTQGFTGPSFCSLGTAFNCDIVNMSSYSKIGPFPVAGLGLVFFLYLFLAALYARVSLEEQKKILALPFLFSISSLGFALYLGGISTLILKTWCMLCVGLYLVCIAVFGLLYSIIRFRLSELGNFMKQIKLPQILFALIVMGLSLFILYSNEKKYAADFEDFDRKAYLDFFYAQKQVPSIEVKGRPLWGTEGAPVTIVEFSDFECPFCKKAALNLKPRLKEFEKNVAFYFFNYPLDKNCNPYMQRDLHQNACNTAKAALCAQEQGKFWPYHDLAFENQPKFSLDQLKGYAQRTGLDLKKFDSCLASEEVKQKILSDIESGKSIGLQGTPMVLLNGRVFKDWWNPVILKLLIEEEIKRSKAKR